jgi:ATP-dependent helicase HrpA
MAEWITRATGEKVNSDDIMRLLLPEHLRFNLRIVDLQGRTIAEGRELTELKRTLRARNSQPAALAQQAAASKHRRWDFGALKPEQTVERRGLRFTVYPTLRDRGDSVELTEARSAAEAQELLVNAVLRLAVLALPEQFKYARKRFADQRELVLLGQGLNTGRPLADSLAERAFADCFLVPDQPLPRTETEFQSMLDRRRAEFGACVDGLSAQVVDALREVRGAREKLGALQAPSFGAVVSDVRAQLDTLMGSGFPLSVPPLLWPHLPRYLKALTRRLDKVAGNLKRDTELMIRVAPFAKAFVDLNKGSHAHTPRAELDRLQWMIEEFRVSLFAQDLRTATPVSEKRLADQLELARAESRRVA